MLVFSGRCSRMNISINQKTACPGAGFAGRLARPGAICLLLAVVTLAVFGPVVRCDFISYDDPEYVVSNPHVQAGLTLNGIGWAFTTGCASNWHPLTWLSHMLDVTLFGAGPVGPHLMNLLLHTANAVLLFLALHQMTAAVGRSAFVAVLFALHPLHVESVAWISERKDVLSTLFWMLTLLAYSRYAQSRARGEGRGAKAIGSALNLRLSAPLDYPLALLFFALGLMSKPMVVTLPFVLLLLDFWPLGRFEMAGARHAPFATFSRLVQEKIPFFALSGISCVITFLAQRAGGAVQPLATLPASLRTENAVVSYLRYLGKCFWPANLAVPYPYHHAHWPLLLVAGAVTVVAGACGATLWWRNRWPFLFSGWFWFLGTLVPVIGLVQVGDQSLADRYTYIPLIGVFLAATWGVAALWQHWRLPPTVAASLAFLILGTCGILTASQLRCWRNSETLARHALALTANNWMAHHSLAVYLADKGKADDALAEYRVALKINPDSVAVLNNLGAALAAQKRFTEAIACLERSWRLRPDRANTHCNLGFALEETGNSDAALAHYAEALRLDPEYATAHFKLGDLLVKRGNNAEAIAHLRRAVELQPDFLDARNNLGVALFNEGKFEDAGGCFLSVLQIQPDRPGLHSNLGNVLAATQHWDKAAREYTEELRLVPDSTDARFGLARALVHLNRQEEAVRHLREALRLRPDFGAAKKLLQAVDSATPPSPPIKLSAPHTAPSP